MKWLSNRMYSIYCCIIRKLLIIKRNVSLNVSSTALRRQAQLTLESWRIGASDASRYAAQRRAFPLADLRSYSLTSRLMLF